MSLVQNLVNLSVKNWSFSLDWLPPTACLVGGAVRDALLNRQGEYLDLDFVLPAEAVETARRIANHYHAGFVVLDEQRQIARVVFERGTVDFAQQEGDSLEADLRRRDFTVNAIAYNPRSCKLIDPLQGLIDLEQGVLRMVSKTNLEDDPLRLLRAYRQAAQLNFTIDLATRATIQTLAALLGKVAAERVQTELGYLLASPQGSRWLAAAWEDGLLRVWFENAKAENIQQVVRVDESAKLIGKIWPKLIETPSDNLRTKPVVMAKLASLVCSVPAEAELELMRLKYSRAEIRTVTAAVKHLPRLLKEGTVPMNLTQQYFFFLDVGDIFPILAVLAVAVGSNTEAIAPLIHRYLDPKDRVAHPKPLVTGNDLMQALQIPPSPKIGKLLTEIQLAWIEGKISTSEDALQFAASLVEELNDT